MRASAAASDCRLRVVTMGESRASLRHWRSELPVPATTTYFFGAREARTWMSLATMLLDFSKYLTIT